MLLLAVIRVKKDVGSPCIAQVVTSIPRSLMAITENNERRALDAVSVGGRFPRAL